MKRICLSRDTKALSVPPVSDLRTWWDVVDNLLDLIMFDGATATRPLYCM